MPTTGTATYTGLAGGSVLRATGGAAVPLAGSTVDLTANFATGSTGALGAVKPGFAGSLTGSGSVAGTFSGAFFGPQAQEFGYDFLVGGVTGADTGFTAIGGAAGGKI